MQTENHTIVAGVVVGIIVLLIAATFIFILVTYVNIKKRKFLQEKANMQLLFNEQLLQSRLEIQEETFNAISREIHDNVGQALSLAKVQVNILEQGNVLDRSMVNNIKETISAVMVELRDIAKSLNADRIRQCSLMELAESELYRIGRLGIFQTNLVVEGKERGIDEQKKLIILRIIQEAFQNILKHAKASRIEIRFYYLANQFCLEIMDDGSGFDQSQPAQNGLGLQNIISRAALIGGNATIKSSLQIGTRITITSPYE